MATQQLATKAPIAGQPAIAQNAKFSYFSPKSCANAQCQTFPHRTPPATASSWATEFRPSRTLRQRVEYRAVSVAFVPFVSFCSSAREDCPSAHALTADLSAATQ